MSPFGDDEGVDPRRALDDRAVEALLTGHPVEGHEDLQELLGAFRAATPAQAPTPSPALTALLSDGLPAPAVGPATAGGPATAPGRTRRRLIAVPAALALAVTGSVGLFAGAAAANQLPARVQTAVADVVESVTSLQVPRPAARPQDPKRTTPAREDASPSESSSRRPSPRPEDAQRPGQGTGQDPRQAGEQGRSEPARNDDGTDGTDGRGADQRPEGTPGKDSSQGRRDNRPTPTPSPDQAKSASGEDTSDHDASGQDADREHSPSASSSPSATNRSGRGGSDDR